MLLASEEWAGERGLPVLAYLSDAETAAVDYVNGGDGLLMAPTYAMPRMLARAGASLGDFDLYEIHEAFASQVLSTLKAWEDPVYCTQRLGARGAAGPGRPRAAECERRLAGPRAIRSPRPAGGSWRAWQRPSPSAAEAAE